MGGNGSRPCGPPPHPLPGLQQPGSRSWQAAHLGAGIRSSLTPRGRPKLWGGCSPAPSRSPPQEGGRWTPPPPRERPHIRARLWAGACGTGSSSQLSWLQTWACRAPGPILVSLSPLSISSDFPYYRRGHLAEQGRSPWGWASWEVVAVVPGPTNRSQEACGQLAKSLVAMAAASSPGSGRRGRLRTPRAQPVALALPSPAPGAELRSLWVPSQALGCQARVGRGPPCPQPPRWAGTRTLPSPIETEEAG